MNSINCVQLKKNTMHQKTILGEQYSQINLFTTACDPFYYPWLFLTRFWFQSLDVGFYVLVLCYVLFYF